MSKRFKTQDYAKFRKLGTRWRKPSGRQSKLRVKKSGSGMLVKIGYRTSRKVRIQNMEVQIINNTNELDNKKAIIISGSVGLKKAKEILEKANQLGIKVMNSRSVKDGLKAREKKAALPKAVAVEKKKDEAKEVTEKIPEAKIEKETEKNEPPKAGSGADIKEKANAKTPEM